MRKLNTPVLVLSHCDLPFLITLTLVWNLNPNMTGWVVIRFSSITFFLKVRKTQNQCTSLFMRKLNTPVLVLSHCDLPFLITLTLVWNLNPNMTGWVVIRFSSITFFLKVRKTQNQCTSLFMRKLNTPVLVLSHCDLPFLITLTLVWNLNPNMTGWVVIRFSSITFFLKVRKTQNQCTSLFMRKLNTPVLVLSHCDLPFLITLTLVWNLNPNMTGWVVIRFSSITFFLKVRKTQNQCTSLFMRKLNTPVLVLSHCDLPFLITLTLVWNLNPNMTGWVVIRFSSITIFLKVRKTQNQCTSLFMRKLNTPVLVLSHCDLPFLITLTLVWNLNPNMTGWVVIRFSSITFFLKVRKTQNQCTSLFMRKLNTPVLVLSHCDLPFLITLTLVWNLNPNMTGWVVIRFSSITFFLKVRKTQNRVPHFLWGSWIHQSWSWVTATFLS